MRASSAMQLLSACCGGFLMTMPGALVDAATAQKEIFDRRTGDDFESDTNCVDSANTRYIQVEVFDYNELPWIVATYTKVAGECGETNFTPYSDSMEYRAVSPVDEDRLQMDMYICAPFGEYELEVQVRSTNGDNNPMNKVAWEIEYGPDEYHIWDTLNTPFYGERNNFEDFAANGATPSDFPYAPIPNKWSEDEEDPGVTFTWPYPEAEAYYSLLYTGPFPPTKCPNLYPQGVAYVGCFNDGQAGWTTAAGPADSDSKNDADVAERFRMYDGLTGNNDGGDDGLAQDGVMTIEKCAGICSGYSYFGLGSAIKCVCGNDVSGSFTEDCGLEDDDAIPEYQYLCSGDSRVLCGTNTKISVYSLDGSAGPPPSPLPPIGDFEFDGCYEDDINDTRVMSTGPIKGDPMSAEICSGICQTADAGYEYFGTQYGEECWCATTLNLVTGNSGSFTGCNMACEGNAGETCGGNDAISVYKIGEATTPKPPTPAPVDNPTPSGGEDYAFDACYEDDVDDTRVMSTGPVVASTMSAEICSGICQTADSGYKYFGTQYGVECWCATALNLVAGNSGGFAGCDMDCAGTAGETCGGNDAISVYEIGEATTPEPPSPTPVPADNPGPSGGDYESEGCSKDDVDSTRAMSTGPITTAGGDMSAEICFGLCKADDAGHVYFGTQYSEECWCSATLADFVTSGHNGCTMACAGNAGEFCGGDDAISVYKIGGTTPTTPIPSGPSGGDSYVELGCRADNQDTTSQNGVRIMTDKTVDDAMTAETCFAKCNVGANTHFGTQYGVECWCGADLASINQFADAPASCDMECGGKSTETCGGDDAMTVYTIITA